eukprot:Pgem_evm1s8666
MLKIINLPINATTFVYLQLLLYLSSLGISEQKVGGGVGVGGETGRIVNSGSTPHTQQPTKLDKYDNCIDNFVNDDEIEQHDVEQIDMGQSRTGNCIVLDMSV